MKTITELNSFWWWRLMKVIFIIFSIAIYVFSFIVPIGYIDGIRTYNPDQIRHFSEQIIAQKE